MADKRMPEISNGIISLTTILCVLCLSILSVLALSTAVSERNLSQKRAAAVQTYYTAESRAARMVNELQQRASDQETFRNFLEKNNITLEDRQYSFQIPIDDEQILAVQMDDGYDITCWQICSIAEWTPDESMHVWDGEELLDE